MNSHKVLCIGSIGRVPHVDAGKRASAAFWDCFLATLASLARPLQADLHLLQAAQRAMVFSAIKKFQSFAVATSGPPVMASHDVTRTIHVVWHKCPSAVVHGVQGCCLKHIVCMLQDMREQICMIHFVYHMLQDVRDHIYMIHFVYHMYYMYVLRLMHKWIIVTSHHINHSLCSDFDCIYRTADAIASGVLSCCK